MLEEILSTRIMVKGAMEKAKSDKVIPVLVKIPIYLFYFSWLLYYCYNKEA